MAQRLVPAIQAHKDAKIRRLSVPLDILTQIVKPRGCWFSLSWLLPLFQKLLNVCMRTPTLRIRGRDLCENIVSILKENRKEFWP